MQPSFNKMTFLIGNQEILQKMECLPVVEPFAQHRIDFLNQVSKILLSNPIAKQYSDIITFAFWIRKANMQKCQKAYITDNLMHVGRGLVFHIAPSNVPVNYAYSLVTGFITGNANIVRLPSKEFEQVSIINQAFHDVLTMKNFEDISDYLVFVRYSRNKEINDYLSSMCDTRVIWGGDNTIKELRESPIKPRATEITFADRYSLCIIDAKAYMQSDNKQQVAHDFYNDTYLTDQNACTSPRVLCWLGSCENIKTAKKLFWDKAYEVIKKQYQVQPVQCVDKLTEMLLASASINGLHYVPMKDNLIIRIQLEKLDTLIQEYRGHSGFFYEYDTENLLELVTVINEKVQTVSYIGPKEMLHNLVSFGNKGIDRVTEVGKTMDFDFVWDGYNLVTSLTRVISGM
ncbi:acyl-CoA reductase [Anaerocolumna jejuensis]|uniref:acyl-CoA reductase n=1 Tax=Anaerocolumna jejuensis TaxID=259063 RepID=UPI003F7B5B53